MSFSLSFENILPDSPLSGTLQLIDYSVEEAATPLAAGDSSGQVGTFSVTVPAPDPNITYRPDTPWGLLATVGPTAFIESDIRLSDSRKGFTLGTVKGSSEQRDSGTITFTGVSRLGQLNVYGIQAQPFAGRLEDGFEYYLSLAGITTQIFVDVSIRDRQVIFPGWHGELWYYLKQMAASQDCDLSLVSGVILLRPIRTRIAIQNRETSRAVPTGGVNLAQAVEVYQYNNRVIEDELVYPPGGWTPEVEVMNVNAGETAEYTLEMSASLSSFEQPVMQTFVAEDYSASSVYTVVGSDGLPVPPALWAQYGGSLTVTLDPDTTRLNVTLVGATGVPTSSGTASLNFSIALGSDFTGNRYSTFRIVGTGVAFDKQKKRIRTGVPPEKTATDIGVTIDNPFISTLDELYKAGTRAARQFAGPVMTLSSSVTALNRRGDTGQATYPTYGLVQDELQADLGPGATYGDVQAAYAGQSYGQVRAYWQDFVQDEDADQVFGNTQGARVYDKKSRRWYRVRQASLTPGGINLSSADNDLTFEDLDLAYAGLTYGDLQAVHGSFTYQQSDLLGVYS